MQIGTTQTNNTPNILGQLFAFFVSFCTGAESHLAPHMGALLKLYGFSAGFILTLYALYTKDVELRQNRRELHCVLILVLFAFILQCSAWLVATVFTVNVITGFVLLLALTLYIFALLYFFTRVVILSYLRAEKFKERSFLQSLKHFPIIRNIARKISLIGSKHYEKTVQDRVSLDKYQLISQIVGSQRWQHESKGFSFLIAYTNVISWLKLVAKLTKEHVTNGETITLITCRHHPSHVISYLEKEWQGSDQKTLRANLVIIDGFTLSFGGDDEVFPKFLQEKCSEGYTIFSASSIPGIHSGCAKAFKHFKKIFKGKRLPGTVIYDGLLVYRHCEAAEHLTRFLIHMIEAERTYSMITIIGEPYVEASNSVFKATNSLVNYSRVLRIKNNSEHYEHFTYPEGLCL